MITIATKITHGAKAKILVKLNPKNKIERVGKTFYTFIEEFESYDNWFNRLFRLDDKTETYIKLKEKLETGEWVDLAEYDLRPF